jgi:hypothetical protein
VPGVPVVDISADPVAAGAELDEPVLAGPHLMGKFRRPVGR